MNNKEKRERIAADVMILLGMLFLLCLICRLWPILLLMILGIFGAAIWVLVHSSDRVEIITPLPMLPEPIPQPTVRDLEKMAYSLILRRITELVMEKYPDARWIWETPEAMQEIEMGGEVFILLNKAGGYRRAKVLYRNLQVIGIDYQPQKSTEMEKNKALEPLITEPPEEVLAEEEEPVVTNYELLAFEWCEAHILELNERCNEAIGQGKSELMILLDDLPDSESWPDICKELERAGLEKVKIATDGILIIL